MAQPAIDLTDSPGADEVARISAGLDEYNVELTGIDNRRPLAVLVRHPATGRLLGGLVGRTSLGLLFVDTVYLPAELRGTGLGKEIIRLAEQEGRRRGCQAAMLCTFAAPGFYEKQGWRVFGEVPCEPPGVTRVFMMKELT
jgi:GNAT superfamily N-acetyltransferase